MDRATASDHASGQTESARASARMRRLSEIRLALVPRIRRVCPNLPDDVFLELIEEMAKLKLRDEELRW